ncbi:LytR C-terminal domain-containing protein [Patescibacteria group bacterium]|nr:LytR C-terminal domain-containing protein [Patescibacteria group bacterium]
MPGVRSAKKKAAKSTDTPPVRHIVEVIEEEITLVPEVSEDPPKDVVDSKPAEALPDEAPPTRETEDEEKQGTDEVEEKNQEASDEKRKEVVEELFTSKNTAETADISMHKNSAVVPIWLWAAIVLGVAAVVGFGLVAVARGSISLPKITVQSTPTPTPAPVATPTPGELQRADLKVQVLNGSGIAGAAGTMKTFLEEKGYTVEDVSNAENYDYQETEIIAKAESRAYLSLLEKDLREDYVIGTPAATLSSDSAYDVQVIVGKE